MTRKVNKETRRWTNIVLLGKLLQKSSIVKQSSTRQISTIKFHSIAEIFKFLKNGLLIELLQVFYWVLETWNQQIKKPLPPRNAHQNPLKNKKLRAEKKSKKETQENWNLLRLRDFFHLLQSCFTSFLEFFFATKNADKTHIYFFL
jgi:hypothetical protein